MVEAGLIEFYLRHLLTRPFYYDEASRAYEIAKGAGFLADLHIAAAPLALGWYGIESAARVLLGNTETGLRAPMFLVLPVLGAATYLLARHWLRFAVSFCVAALLLANLWIVNYGLQLKSYSYEALFAVATVGLYLLTQRRTWRPAQLLGLYAALGLTCIFSLPNLFVLGPLLVLDLFRTLRARHQAALRVTGEAVAGLIALAHYTLFVRLQSVVAGTGFFQAQYPPHGLAAFLQFIYQGLDSYLGGTIIGVVSADQTPASYTLPPDAHHLLSLGLLLLLAAGVVAAARDAAGRTLLVVVGGALLLELIASALHQWPFGLIRTNIFVLPLLYILAGMGAVWLARTLTGRQQAAKTIAWWRPVATVAVAAVFAGTVAVGAVATAEGYSETSAMQFKPTMFGGVKAAVADAREVAGPGDIVIIRADRSPAVWYAAPWLYYMNLYQGYPAKIAALPRVPSRNTISVVYVTPRAVDSFLAAHRGSPTVLLLEFNVPGNLFPQSAHQESLNTLRRFGYCPVSDVAYPLTGQLTVLRGGCAKT